MSTPDPRTSIIKLAILAGSITLMTGQIVFSPAVVGQTNLQTTDQTKSQTKAHNVVATQIDSNNVTELQRKGPDAIGGLGDWFISNGTLCAVITAVEHEGEFSSKGGSLVDLGFCGRDDDHFAFTHDLLNGSRRRPLDAESVRIELFDGAPSIVVESRGDGASLSTRYYFSDDADTELRITKRYQRVAGGDVNFVSPLNFNLRSLEPFIFNSRNHGLSNGFQNQDFVERGSSAIGVAARNADTIILPSPRDAKSSVAYGWQLKSAKRLNDDVPLDLPFFVLADPQSTVMLVLTDTFYIGDGSKVGWLQLPQVPLLTLQESAAIETEEVIYVGQHGDVASVTDQLLPQSQRVSGQIDDANSAIHVFQANGAPLTQITPQDNGSFSFNAPAGDYTLKALAYGGRVLENAFTVAEGGDNVIKLTLPKAAKLNLPRGQAMRLVFVGIDGTAVPDFAGELSAASTQYDDRLEIQDPISQIFLAGVEGDRREVDIAPGNYRVYATKGPEYSLEQTDISVAAGDTLALDIEIPQRVISTPNYIASDLHVHSGLSFDNAFAETERVRTFTAEHGEVMVSSEHDLPTDYAPYISAMGVEDKIVSIPAAEVTSLLPTANNPYTAGHANFFPFEPKHTHYRNGMVNHEGKRLRDTIHSIKVEQPNVVVQLNHPRHDSQLSGNKLPSDWEDLIDDGNYLDHMGSAGHPYNAHKELHTHPNNVLIERHPVTGVRDLDFDLIEVVNPGGEQHEERVEAVRQDWLSLLKQGERKVATANSDSHNAHEQVAVPRTMVAIKDDRVSHFDRAEFIHNLKAGNAYGTTGPMLEISMLDTPKNIAMGQTFRGVRGTLEVNINTADWINVEQLEVQINGVTVDTHQLKDALQQTVRLPLEFDKDSFVTVEVFGPADNHYATIYPGLKPYAFSNPIYVDHDQDGKWQAPGL